MNHRHHQRRDDGGGPDASQGATTTNHLLIPLKKLAEGGGYPLPPPRISYPRPPFSASPGIGSDPARWKAPFTNWELNFWNSTRTLDSSSVLASRATATPTRTSRSHGMCGRGGGPQ